MIDRKITFVLYQFLIIYSIIIVIVFAIFFFFFISHCICIYIAYPNVQINNYDEMF